MAEVNVVTVVFEPVLGVMGEPCVPAGILFEMTAVGSMTAMGWIEIFMLLPLPTA